MSFTTLIAIVTVTFIIGLTVVNYGSKSTNMYDVRIACVEKTGNRIC